MNLLAGTCYDPAVAVTETTASGSGLAITAMDTTNLRLSFTVPPSGFVRVRMEGVVHGATTFPSVLLAVMSGSDVVKRQAPVQSLGNTAVATAMVNIESDFIVSGLTAGEARTWDAAYGVETSVASTGIKYGGPNNASPGNNAFGGFAFEVWDPCPFYTPASGVPPASPVIAYTSGIKTKTDFLPAATAGAAGGVFIAGTNAATTITTGLTTTLVGNVSGNLTGIVASVSGLTVANLDATISSRMATYTQPTGFLAASFPADPASDTTVNTRLATAGYTAPDNTSITAILAEVSGLSVTDITAIKAKTDSLTFTIAGEVDANTQSINDTALTGDGSGTPWGPV